MDEVTNGLDYESLNILKEDLIRSKNEKIILLTGHQFEFYEEIIDDLYVIKNKKILKVDKGGLKKIYERAFLSYQIQNLFSNFWNNNRFIDFRHIPSKP